MRWLAGVSAVVIAVTLGACGPKEPKVMGGSPDLRRLTEEQYANIIADVFGEQIVIAGHFDPILRTDGLYALGTRSARITPSGFEQYYDLAASVANQVTSPDNRDDLIPCKPAQANAADDACAKQFFAKAGRLLYRRPLTERELATPVKAAHDYAGISGDFYEGIAEGLSGMLTTPEFLFIADTTEKAGDGQLKLTNYAKASRLSFLLWNTTPDEQLLTAAEKGELDKDSSLKREVERMIASPRLDRGLRAFFKDFFDFAKFETLEKDPVIYPVYGMRTSEDAKEQMLRTITNHLINHDGDYRDLYTTRKTFITPTLARIYHVPALHPDGGWSEYEFPEGDNRAGLLTQIGFVAVNAHPGRSSPTIRGRAIRELVLCQKVPDPPGDVDFSLFNDPNSPNRTAKQRLTAHATAPACAGCHKVTDPVGLALENFDGAGEFRTTENEVPIDTTGNLDGVAYTNAADLGKAMRNSLAVPSCLVDRMAAYAVGRTPSRDDAPLITYLEKDFEKDGYKVPELLRTIALSDFIFAVSPPKDSKAAENVSQENRS